MTNATADPDVQTVDHGPDVVPVPLTTLVRGQRATLCATPPEELDGELLRAMGMRTDCQLKLCRVGEPCIVAVDCDGGGGCRIGMARSLAERVMVRPAD